MNRTLQVAPESFERLARAIWGDYVIDAMRPGESARECSDRLKKEARERAERIKKARVRQ